MKFTILGCGSSMGVPRPDGFFGNCDPKNKKNYRTRCSALIETSEENILIDTSPDLRQQLLDQKVKNIDKVFYSHMHADQTHGINDLRAFFIQKKNLLKFLQTPQHQYISRKIFRIVLQTTVKNILLH
jgi:phosphoribosyl 1,2-cyclic phosphate phosphodiesterase